MSRFRAQTAAAHLIHELLHVYINPNKPGESNCATQERLMFGEEQGCVHYYTSYDPVSHYRQPQLRAHHCVTVYQQLVFIFLASRGRTSLVAKRGQLDPKFCPSAHHSVFKYNMVDF